MSTWNGSYELLPQDRNNPGYGAVQIRTLKADVRERLNREHIFGEDETTVSKPGGTHREGGARAYVEDSDTANRGDTQIATPNSEIGHVEFDMTAQPATERQQDGTNLEDIAGFDASANFKKQIKVVMTTIDPATGGTATPLSSTVETVFDWDDFVNLLTDQILDGIKTFVHAPLSQESVTIGDSYDSADAQKMVRADELRNRFVEARDENIFTDGGVGSDQNIYCDEVHATKVFGAVFG